jgi:hypothetical protein
MAKEEKIIKCKYAGDPQDEFCCNCDGIHPVDDEGKVQPATLCGGYEPEEQKQEEPVREEPAQHSESPAESCEASAPNTECVKGITTVIRAESGVSREVNGTWYKFMFSEERIVPEGCDIEAEKQALWDSVNAEVDAQLEAVRN